MPARPKHRRRVSRDLFLGIDGGGTKTHTVLIGADGGTLEESRNGPSNPLRVGVREAVANITSASIDALERINRTPDDVIGVVAGLAGARRDDIRMQMQSGVSSVFPRAKVIVLTDADIALYATTNGGPGIVVISGTGSVCYGTDGKGRTAVAGGWGPIAGDEGAGFYIAREALTAVAKASDGRGPATSLSDLAAEYFRAPSADDLMVAIYSPSTDHKRLAGFAEKVIDAAREGDKVSKAILEDAGRELGVAACAVIRALNFGRKKFPVGVVGGVFAAGGLITGSLSEKLRECAPNSSLKFPEMSPAVAAARMALELYHQSPSR